MKKKITKVMGFGTFDGIHKGHMDFFRQLKELEDNVYVVVACDINVEKNKGRLPEFNESERLEAVKNSALVSHAILGSECDFYKCIKDHNPDVIGLGYDQEADTNYLKRKFPHIKIVRLKPFEPEKYKSSFLNH